MKALTVAAAAAAAAAIAAGLFALSGQPPAEFGHPMSSVTASPTVSNARAGIGRKSGGSPVVLERPGVDGYPTGAITPPVLDVPPGVFSYSAIVARYASDSGVPAALAHAVIRVESSCRPKSRGSAGEIGLMQIKVGTARMLGYSGSASGLFDPETNIKYGIRYLAMAYRLAGRDTCGTILRYNAGHGAKRMNRGSAALCAKVKRAQAEHDELVAQYLRVLTRSQHRSLLSIARLKSARPRSVPDACMADSWQLAQR